MLSQPEIKEIKKAFLKHFVTDATLSWKNCWSMLIILLILLLLNQNSINFILALFSALNNNVIFKKAF